MNIAIVGSRDYAPLSHVREFVGHLHPMTVVISGGAGGVDSEAERAAKARRLTARIIKPQWKRPDGSYNKAAGFERNHDIVKAADRVVAFWDGQSRGTAHSIELAKKAGKPCWIITPDWTMDRIRTVAAVLCSPQSFGLPTIENGQNENRPPTTPANGKIEDRRVYGHEQLSAPNDGTIEAQKQAVLKAPNIPPVFVPAHDGFVPYQGQFKARPAEELTAGDFVLLGSEKFIAKWVSKKAVKVYATLWPCAGGRPTREEWFPRNWIPVYRIED